MGIEPKQDGLLVRIPEKLLPAGFDTAAESFAITFSGSELVILRRKPKGAPLVARQGVRLWGDLASFRFADVLQLLFNNHQTGILSVELPDARKTVYFHHGDAVFAQSSLADDRLGEYLLGIGKISRREFDGASKLISGDRKLGKILVDLGAITAKELFDGVRGQAEHIIYSLFECRGGKFSFFESGLDPEKVVALNLETREILVEGLRRELGISGMPYETVFPVWVGRAANLELNIEERNLQNAVSSGDSIRDMIERLEFGELQTLRLLSSFLQADLIRITERAPEPSLTGSNKLEQTVSDFNSIFMDVFSILNVKVEGVDVLGRLNSFFEDMPADVALVFDGVRFQLDGSLDTLRVLANLHGMERSDRVGLAIKAFNELLYFIVFEMRNYLSHDDAERLMEIIQNMELF